jgi:hypothetical protein
VRGARGAVEAEVYAEYMIQPRMLKKIVQKMKRVMFAAERASVNRSEGRCGGEHTTRAVVVGEAVGPGGGPVFLVAVVGECQTVLDAAGA